MAEGWSRLEVEATVADYLAMLEAELRGEPYSKTEHRRALARLLDGRSEGAIERKHQNISAILIELDLPYIDGYKPLRNYQQLLYDVTANRIVADRALQATVEAEVRREAPMPTVDDILAVLVAAPRPSERSTNAYRRRSLEMPTRPAGFNYLAMEAGNRSLGERGEEFVVRYETARLLAAGAEELATRVEHVARTQGDGAGFDIVSFDASGRERFIEVKTTRYGAYTPFYVSRNEVATSRDLNARYHLYRLFDFRDAPRLYVKRGDLAHEFALDPCQYVARIA